MNLLLLQDVENLGTEGEIVAVKNGYGRNYLIPRSLARQATPAVVRAFEEEKRQKSRKLSAQADQARALAAQLEAVTLTIPARAGDDGRLFGSVTSQQVADLLVKQGFEVDRRRLTLDEDVRATGTFGATVRLHADVSAHFQFTVVPETNE